MNFYTLLADLVVAIHLLYIAYVIFGELAILVGLVFRWAWVRNPWFRFTHLFAILIVVFEAISNIECPLTTLEDNLRAMGGQPVTETNFMGRLMHDLLYYDAPVWVFTVCYIAFALLILGTLILAPPCRKKVLGSENKNE